VVEPVAGVPQLPLKASSSLANSLRSNPALKVSPSPIITMQLTELVRTEVFKRTQDFFA
jgi:hypothetical protein